MRLTSDNSWTVLSAALLFAVAFSGITAAPSVAISSEEIHDICKGSGSYYNTSDDAPSCTRYCGNLFYNPDKPDKYNYEEFETCYRCCYTGGACIPPVANASACSGHGTCLQLKSTTPGAKPISKCQCNPEYIGEFCERKETECATYGPDRIKCAGHGACDENQGKCVCDKGFEGEACQYRKCPVSTNGKGICAGQSCNRMKGVCDCGLLWKGDSCMEKACPRNENGIECSGVGKCNDGVCTCASNYKGNACQLQACPRNLAGEECGGVSNGICDVTGTCRCRAEFKGPACSDKACPMYLDAECGGRGKCVEGICQCTPGEWKGKTCEVKGCPIGLNGFECNLQGFCNVRGVCECSREFKGPSCSDLVCPKDEWGNECSKDQGTCIKGLCECKPEFRGEYCQIKKCPIDPVHSNLECVGPDHGTCVSGVCQCKPGWKGGACQIARCPGKDECSGHGECNDGKCRCNAGFKGEDCSELECPKENLIECNLQGSCVNGKCACRPDWRGNACENKVCGFSTKNKLECGGHGTCGKNGICTCDAGWRGEVCDIKICPYANNLECNNQGSCSEDGKCVCYPRYRGQACETYYEAKMAYATFNNNAVGENSGAQGKHEIEGKARINVVAGEIYQAQIDCNVANMDNLARGKYGNVYMEMSSTGPVKPLNGAVPNLGVAANVGFWQPMTIIGMFAAVESGEVVFSGNYWAGDPSLFATYWHCSISAVRVNSGRANVATSNSLDFNPHIAVRGQELLTSLAVNLDAKANEQILVRLACTLWTTSGATAYMRVVNSEGGATEVLPSNWITATGKAGGVWSQGLSQAVYKAPTTGSYRFQGSYHVGDQTGSYGPCTIAAQILNDTWAGETSNAGYSKTWTNRLANVGASAITPASAKDMDWSTTVTVSKDDAVRAVITCNLINSGYANSAVFHYSSLRLSKGSAKTLLAPQFTKAQGNGEWQPGTAEMIVKATDAGPLTFTGTYLATAGSTPVTYVYCNIIAENLGYTQNNE